MNQTDNREQAFRSLLRNLSTEVLLAMAIESLLDGINIPADLQPKMEARIKRVANKLGYTQPISVAFDPLGAEHLSANIRDNAIYYGADIKQHDNDLDGGIAHEIGHLVHGLSISNRREQELFADAYAARHGYGEQLIAHLQAFGEHNACDDSCEHGKMSDRIARIRAAGKK